MNLHIHISFPSGRSFRLTLWGYWPFLHTAVNGGHSSPKHSDTYTEYSDTYTERSDTCPQLSDTYPEHSDYYPERSDTYLELLDTYPKHSDTYPKRSDNYPELSDTYLVYSSTITPCLFPSRNVLHPNTDVWEEHIEQFMWSIHNYTIRLKQAQKRERELLNQSRRCQGGNRKKVQPKRVYKLFLKLLKTKYLYTDSSPPTFILTRPRFASSGI